MNYSVKAVVHSSKTNKDGTKTIQIRVIINRAPKFYRVSENGNVTVLDKDWDAENELVRKSDDDHKIKNQKIRARKADMETILRKMEVVHENDFTLITFNHILNKNGVVQAKHKFTEFLLEEFSYQQTVEHLRESSLITYKGLLTVINLFDKNICIEDIDASWIFRFKEWLVNKHKTAAGTPLMKNTFSKRLQHLSLYLYRAKRKGIISENPCEDLKGRGTGFYEFERNERPALTYQEIHRLISLAVNKNETPGLHKAKHRFLFACCTGLAHEDLNDLQWNNINMGADEWILKYVRRKTSESINEKTNEKKGKVVVIPLLPLAKDILKSLPRKDNFVFERISNQKYNDHLYTLGAKAEIEKIVTSHVARHTCATLLLNEGKMDKWKVKEILGHHTIEQTESYAKWNDATLVNAMKEAGSNLNFTLQTTSVGSVDDMITKLEQMEHQQQELAKEIKRLRTALKSEKAA